MHFGSSPRRGALERLAFSYARAAHESIGQKRKYTFEPYWVHPVAVAELVKGAEHDEAMIAAALLHDVLEDVAPTRPDFSAERLRSVFGEDVVSLVVWLTDVTTLADGNRAQRKAMERERLSHAPARAQTIKVADLIDNSSSILRHDPNFAAVYLPEVEALLDVLVLADPVLRATARPKAMVA